jgi:iron complex transport system substrate-binding protein
LPCRASRIVTDESGRSMTVPDHPHRVICLAPNVTDTAFSLGAADDIVAVSDYVQFPVEATRKPSVGTILTPSIEAIVSFHPDLLLAVKTEEGSAAIDKLRLIGLPVFVVDPHGIDGILRSVVSIGLALNRAPQAAAEVAHLRAQLAAVRARAAGKTLISVLLPIDYDPVITIGKGAFPTEMIAAAGGQSVTADLKQEWPQISIEAIVARAPQALLLGRDSHITLAMLKDRPGWRSVPAVVNGRAYSLDSRLYLPSPSAFDGLEDLARQFHP